MLAQGEGAHADKHPSYKPFFKQVMTGVPKSTVRKAMERKFLNPEFLENPKGKVVYRPKPAHKKTALDVIAEEEARQAIKEEEKEIAIAKASINPLDNINWNAPEFQGFVGFFRKIKVYAEEKKKQMEKNAFKYGPPYNEDYGGSILEEVNKPQASTLDVHQMLLEGADPRVSLVHDGKKHGQQEEEEGHTGRERFRRRGGRGDLWCVCACSGRGFLDLNKNDIQVLKVRSGNRLAQSLDRRVGHGASARNLGCVGVQYERGRLFWQVQCQWRS